MILQGCKASYSATQALTIRKTYALHLSYDSNIPSVTEKYGLELNKTSFFPAQFEILTQFASQSQNIY